MNTLHIWNENDFTFHGLEINEFIWKHDFINVESLNKQSGETDWKELWI